MARVPPGPRSAQLLAALALVTVSLAAQTPTADSQAARVHFQHWAAAHAAPIRTVEPGGDNADLAALKPIIGSAHVVALGEPAHGAHEPLAFRNRLFQYLVTQLGFTAIALESGFPESRRLYDFVAGGPGDAGQLTRDNLTWGFGAFQEDEELVQWMRSYNADTAHHRKVRFYGIDLSLGGPGGSIPTPVAIEDALSYLTRVDTAAASRMQARFQPYLSRLPEGGAPFSPAEHDSLSAVIEELIALMERNRRAYVAASSPLDYAWSHHDAIAARQADRVFRVVPPLPPGGGIPAAAWRAVSVRDSAMAENVRWVLAQEGPAGRVLVFAYDAHVKNAPTEGGIWNVLARPPTAMGQVLRSFLDDDLVIIGISGANDGRGLPPASSNAREVDAALAGVGPGRFVLDLRASRTDSAVTSWLAQPRALRTNFTTFLTVAPGVAFDALVFIDTLTPAHIRPVSP